MRLASGWPRGAAVGTRSSRRRTTSPTSCRRSTPCCPRSWRKRKHDMAEASAPASVGDPLLAGLLPSMPRSTPAHGRQKDSCGCCRRATMSSSRPCAGAPRARFAAISSLSTFPSGHACERYRRRRHNHSESAAHHVARWPSTSGGRVERVSPLDFLPPTELREVARDVPITGMVERADDPGLQKALLAFDI